MGLTVHYTLRSFVKTTEAATQLVTQMRDLARQFPFAAVKRIVHLEGTRLQQPWDQMRKRDQRALNAVLAGSTYVPQPWHRKQGAMAEVRPLEVIYFYVEPGPGSEWAEIGLARLPTAVTARYRPDCDDRFIDTIKNGGSTTWRYNWQKFQKWAEKQTGKSYNREADFEEDRTIRTRCGTGWRLGGFCKTQYASDPAEGGVPNFLRCHLSLIHLLEAIGRLPSMTVDYSDEGHYGKANYSDDWQEAYAAGREPTYVDHPATYSVPVLLKELGDYNNQVAAFAGAMKDALGEQFEAPILNYANFEQLEFQGTQNPDLQPFLAAMARLAENTRAAITPA